jgi:short-subunit dehydrogenase
MEKLATVKTPIALVTGPSSGIGLELAQLLAAGGLDLVLVARSAERLDRIARDLRGRTGVSVDNRPRDLSKPAAARALWQELVDDDAVVGTLVNNAVSGSMVGSPSRTSMRSSDSLP